jgi:CDP-diacylglycerol--serine O-phosphatidyltransferase
MFAVLPTLLTLGNAVSGLGAITFASRWTGFDAPSSFFLAGLFIYVAMLFDALDGAAARWTNQTSEFGAQLDSLCDAISFGAAPAVLMLELAQPLGYHPRVLWVIAALYVVCAVLRLARFGVETGEEHDSSIFRGLPSPGAAAVVASFPVMLYGPQLFASDGFGPSDASLAMFVTRILPIATFAAAWLMVSRIPYRHMFHRFIQGRRTAHHLTKLLFALAIIAAIPRVAVPVLVCWYAFATPVWVLFERYVRPRLFPRPTPAPSSPTGERTVPTLAPAPRRQRDENSRN